MSASRKKDDAGIRLAPSPMSAGDTKLLPEVRQDYVISPKLRVEEGKEDSLSTDKDMQPKEAAKRSRRRAQAKNAAFGVVMLLLTVAALLPYALSAAGVKAELSAELIPERFNVIGRLIDAAKLTAAGVDTKALWLNEIPDLILAIGILSLVINLIKSAFCFLGARKSKRYGICAAVYLIAAVAVLACTLAGFEEIGLERPDFSKGAEILKGEAFIIAAEAVAYFALSVLCSALSADKNGYIR